MNEGVLIRYLGKWMTFSSSFGLGLRGGVRWGSSVFVEVLGPFFRIGFGSDFVWILGGFWEVFGRPKWSQNRFLGSFLASFFSNAIFHRFFVDFGRLRTLKICTAPRREHDFYKIDVFKKGVEQSLILVPFWEAKTMKNQ